jgi:hypothetical protein
MLRSDYPEPFKSQKEYIEHLEGLAQILHDNIEKNEHIFDKVNKWSFTSLAIFFVLVALRILFNEMYIYAVIFETSAIALLVALLLFWFGFRNILFYHHKKKVKDYKHYVEELEDVYKTLIKEKEGEEWNAKEKNLEQKSLKLFKLLKADKEHFIHFLVHLGYLILVCAIIIVLKFVFGKV